MIRLHPEECVWIVCAVECDDISIDKQSLCFTAGDRIIVFRRVEFQFSLLILVHSHFWSWSEENEIVKKVEADEDNDVTRSDRTKHEICLWNKA